jgi:hypothetical protein
MPSSRHFGQASLAVLLAMVALALAVLAAWHPPFLGAAFAFWLAGLLSCPTPP